MKLLDAQQVTAEKRKTEESQSERIRRLNKEESDAVKRVNDARDLEAAEKKRLDDLVQDHRNKAAAEICEIDVQISARKRELGVLMKPIDEIRKDAEARLEHAINRDIEVNKREAKLEAQTQDFIELAEKLVTRENEVEERASELDRREEKVQKAEEDTKRSAGNLAVKWGDYHKSVNALNARSEALERQAKEIADARRANEAVREANEKESSRLVQERRAIHDAYIALEQAKKHLGVE